MLYLQVGLTARSDFTAYDVIIKACLKIVSFLTKNCFREKKYRLLYNILPHSPPHNNHHQDSCQKAKHCPVSPHL